MHDIVDLSLSVMVGLADGSATLAAHHDERSADAPRILGDTGRQAMGELCRALGVLRDATELTTTAPRPTHRRTNRTQSS
jgi:hypothetical protein